MRTYEMTVIFKSTDEEFSKGKELLLSEMEKQGSAIKSQEDKGVRNLAYLIGKEQRGHYYYLEADLDPTKVSTLERALRLADPVLKYLFVRKED
jgi:small subunit ribosomal protein S6